MWSTINNPDGPFLTHHRYPELLLQRILEISQILVYDSQIRK